MLRAAAFAALLLLALGLTSCGDTPTAPKAIVPVSGTILDRDGNPIQAVYIYFEDRGPHTAGSDPFIGRAITNVSGQYSASMPEGRYRIYILPPSFTAYAGIVLDDRTIQRPGLRLDHRFQWARLAIHPTASGGQTAADLRAYVFPEADDAYSHYFFQGDTRLSGSEREAFVPAGSYRVQLYLYGIGFGYPVQTRSVSFSADTTLEAAFTGNVVTVHVTGQNGIPMENAHVTAYSPSATVPAITDAAGSATLYMPSATYRMQVASPSSEIMPRSMVSLVVSADATIDFDLSGTEWSGILRRISDDQPIPDVGVEADDINGTRGAFSQTDGSGRFHFIVATGRLYRITAYDDQWRTLGSFEPVASGSDSTFDLRVDPSTAHYSGQTPRFRPTPPVAPGAPASAAVDPAFRRRSFRTGG
ncbi:MAG TPA: carboxypeptidase-like regulatory domain-containing protein [Candidatus Eisenbacteria bacterium]|nr:carboxypeptidase-like regulatory domain-containing protein [Candidatus Eisenbacteria bacterium]